MTCYYYHRPGHVKQDFPQRKGSQGYGTPQSQSSVGPVRTQFVPSNPNAGQRNQHQSQGVVQEISATQRGQGMGQGLGQGSRVETSRT